MATKRSPTELTEPCARCDAATPHSVTIELRTESTKAENREFSREPYRVAECSVCGASRSMRMNNA